MTIKEEPVKEPSGGLPPGLESARNLNELKEHINLTPNEDAGSSDNRGVKTLAQTEIPSDSDPSELLALQVEGNERALIEGSGPPSDEKPSNVEHDLSSIEGTGEEGEEAAESGSVKSEKSVIGEDDDWAESMLDDQDPESAPDDSPARFEWLTQKREENEKNEYLDRIMAMVGHEEVKAHFLAVKAKVDVAKRWGEDMKELDLDLILHGNHGTGDFSYQCDSAIDGN